MNRPHAFTNPLSCRRGIALLVTLAIITLLIASVLEMNRRVRAQITAAALLRDRTTRVQMAESGTQMAMALLIEDKKNSQVDTLQEDWANPEKLAQAVAQMPFERGRLVIVIRDALAKIQVNALVDAPYGRQFNVHQQLLWERFIDIMNTRLKPDEDFDATAIINALKDWLDAGDDDAITGLSGAESDYYQSQKTPYACRNGPIFWLPELLRVKGVSALLYHGRPKTPGIAAYTTVQGAAGNDNALTFEGKININTAALPVLAAILPTENQDLAQAIFDFRSETSNGAYVNDLTAPDWYKNVPGAANLKIDSKLITTASDIFEIESSAELNGVKFSTVSIVHRLRDKKSGQTICRVLSRRTQ